MTTRRIFPAGDREPNDGTPSPPGDHFAAVDETPSDGATTHIQHAVPGYEVFWSDASGVLITDLITGVTVRCSAAGSGGASAFRIGLRMGGVDYLGALHSPAPGSGYSDYSDTFPHNPATGAEWTLTALLSAHLVRQQVSMEVALPRPAFSTLEALVTVVEAAPRPAGDGATPTPRAVGTDDLAGLTATVSTPGPSATAAAVTPAATAATPSPSGEGS